MCIQDGEIELPCKHYLAHSQYNKENDRMIKLLCELVSVNVVFFFAWHPVVVVNVLAVVVH